MEKRIINRDMELIGSSSGYPSESSDKGAEEQLHDIAYKAWRTLVNNNWANVQGEIENAIKDYASIKEKEAINRTVQECIDKAVKISFNTEDQTGCKFTAVVLEEIVAEMEALKK